MLDGFGGAMATDSGEAPGRGEETSHAIIGAALRVHFALGPGVLESAYEACLARELERSGLQVKRQVQIPLVYEGANVGIACRVDMLVDERVIVETRRSNESSRCTERSC